jgi:hypothetical protein
MASGKHACVKYHFLNGSDELHSSSKTTLIAKLFLQMRLLFSMDEKVRLKKVPPPNEAVLHG